MKANLKNLTTVKRKSVGVPITNQEKFEKLKIKNPAIEKLREVFGLEIQL